MATEFDVLKIIAEGNLLTNQFLSDILKELKEMSKKMDEIKSAIYDTDASDAAEAIYQSNR